MPPVFRTRYAPSPTGYLHLGHVRNAVWTWDVSRAWNGRVVLRIEDHDSTRCREEYVSALLEDLDWLGFVPDEVAPRQSERHARYEEVLAGLRDRGLAYVCACSRKDIAEIAGDEFNEETRYPGTCRELGLEPGPGRGWRVIMEPGSEKFTDLLLGEQVQDPSLQCGDLLVRDRLGNWTYQFAVTVDDMDQGIDLVIRGEDLLSSTGRQLRLARMLGRKEMPIFLHHSLIIKASGEKLSKASGDTGVREMRAARMTVDEVLRVAGHGS
ncbi:MAG TPA: glutamate--tRNA ligase family protein [Gemmatimonadales bacterium]|nr:glutamate--tRNA ligase family protein [Gemmatimonadales bacterium]